MGGLGKKFGDALKSIPSVAVKAVTAPANFAVNVVQGKNVLNSAAQNLTAFSAAQNFLLVKGVGEASKTDTGKAITAKADSLTGGTATRLEALPVLGNNVLDGEKVTAIQTFQATKDSGVGIATVQAGVAAAGVASGAAAGLGAGSTAAGAVGTFAGVKATAGLGSAFSGGSFLDIASKSASAFGSSLGLPDLSGIGDAFSGIGLGSSSPIPKTLNPRGPATQVNDPNGLSIGAAGGPTVAMSSPLTTFLILGLAAYAAYYYVR